MNKGKQKLKVQKAALGVARFHRAPRRKTVATGAAMKNQLFWKNSKIVGNFSTMGAHKVAMSKATAVVIRPTMIKFLSEASFLNLLNRSSWWVIIDSLIRC